MRNVQEIPYADHDEWLAIRNKYIGGSDAGSVVGLNPYKGRLSLWAEKTGQVEPFTGNLTTEVGAYLEEFVAQKWCEETGKKVRRKNRILVNKNYPYACADVDRMVVGENAALECKTTTSVPIMKSIRSGVEFPEMYYAQCVHYMAIGGFDRMYLAVLAENRQLYTFVLERDEDEIAALMDAEQRFWAMVANRIPPEVDGQKDCGETLNKMFPLANDERVDLTPLETNLQQYAALGEQINTLKKSRDAIANAVKQAMGSAGRGESPGFKVSWTESSRKTFDTKRFVSDYPGVDLNAYYNTSVTRTLRVTERG